VNSSESQLTSYISDSPIPEHLARYADSVHGLRRVGNQFWNRGWSLGTSSNYSVLVEREPLTLLLTASGKDKGHLQGGDFVLVDENGTPTISDQPKSSAETLLHCLAVKKCNAGAVLHTHSVWSTILSEHYFPLRGLWIEGFEMLKGLEGITTHESRYWLPIFDNTQDIPALAAQVTAHLDSHPNTLCLGYLIRQHGLYTWGRDLPAAVRHMEVIEFLLECIGRKTKL